MKTRQVQVGVVRHSDGFKAFVGWTIADVYEKVYVYVKKWWTEFCEDAEMPEDHGMAVFEYFTAATGKESFDIVEGELSIE